MIAALRAAWLLLLTQGIQIPPPTGLVNDFAHVVQPDAVQRMERIAEDVRTKSRGEIAIVTLPEIGTRDVQEVALQIGREWKVGKIGNPGDPTRNAGAVILLVPRRPARTVAVIVSLRRGEVPKDLSRMRTRVTYAERRHRRSSKKTIAPVWNWTRC